MNKTDKNNNNQDYWTKKEKLYSIQQHINYKWEKENWDNNKIERKYKKFVIF
jgi:hypothetical protein